MDSVTILKTDTVVNKELLDNYREQGLKDVDTAIELGISRSYLSNIRRRIGCNLIKRVHKSKYRVNGTGMMITKKMIDDRMDLGLTETEIAKSLGIRQEYLKDLRKEKGWEIMYRSNGWRVKYGTPEESKKAISNHQKAYREKRKVNNMSKYKSITIDGVPMHEHRHVMEQILGRELLTSEVVHHINGIRDDNRKENLLLFENQAAHAKHHITLRKV